MRNIFQRIIRMVDIFRVIQTEYFPDETLTYQKLKSFATDIFFSRVRKIYMLSSRTNLKFFINRNACVKVLTYHVTISFPYRKW